MRSQKSRSRGNKNRNNNSNRSGVNIVNRVFDSSGPEGKVRGTPQQIIDKYQQLHRDAQLSNDRVAAENFAQHSEHYARMLGEAMREQEARREAQEAQHRERQQNREEQQQNRPPPARDEDAPRMVSEAAVSDRGPDPASAEQPDVIDLKSEDADSGLVETVENASKPRRGRKPKPQTDAPESAAEPTEAKPKPKPKPRRRPKAAAPDASSPSETSNPAEDATSAETDKPAAE